MKVAILPLLILSMMACTKGTDTSTKTRKLAQTADSGLGESDASEGFVQLMNRINGAPADGDKTAIAGVQSADELDALIKDVDQNYNRYTDDAAKLLAAQISFLKVYRGIIYRMRGLVEDYDFVRSSVISGLRLAGQATNIYLPDTQWGPGFDYTIEPFDFSKYKTAEINDDASFRKYLVEEFIPALNDFDDRVKAINFSNIVWDNKVFNRNANFVDSEDQYVKLGANEKHALQSVIYGSLSASYGLAAYSLDGLFDTINEIAKKFGINAAFDMGGSLASARTQIIKDHTNLFILDGANGRARLAESYKYLKMSVQSAKRAIDGVARDGNDADDGNLLNFAAINAVSRVNNNILENVSNIVLSGPSGEIASAIVDGEVVEVRLQSMFEGPNVPTDLKAFLPTGFDEEMNNGRVRNGFSKHPVRLVKNGNRYIDFTYGQPNKWDTAVFSKYFPNATTNDEIRKTARILSQSYGGAGVGIPLSTVMF